jgi:topoisomerase IV subunit A
MVYNMVYLDGKSGRSMVKRFNVKGITRDKEYDLTKGEAGSQILHLTVNPNGEAEIISVNLSARSRAKIKTFDFDFSTIEIKGRGAGGNILTKYPVRKINIKTEGKSTLGGVDIYYDASIGRLNRDGVGRLLGNFNPDDSIFVAYNDGSYELTTYELTNRYDFDKIDLIRKFHPKMVLTVIYYDGVSKNSYIKKFTIETTTLNKKFLFISENKGSKLLYVSDKVSITLLVELMKKRSKETEEFKLDELVSVKGWRAVGNKFSGYPILKIKELTGVESDMNDLSEEIVEEEDIISNDEDSGNSSTDSSSGNQSETEENKIEAPPRVVEEKKSDQPKEKAVAKESTDKSQKDENGYHPGDTIEMKIDLSKLKKGKNQLGLFDD